MRSVKSLLAAGAATLFSTVAFAADLPIAPPPMYAPPPPADFGGWYLRGDIGMTNQSMKSLHSATIDYDNANLPAGSLQNHGFGFDSSPLFGLGVGYQFNSWFRADLTGEYRGKANFHGSQNVQMGTFIAAPNFAGVDNYSASKSEWVVMANAYVDLGTWWCVTPFVGAGVGASHNKISGFRDDTIGRLAGGGPFVGTYYADDAGKWNFAWALHAGLAYKVTPNVTLELAYRYINLGDGVTGSGRFYDTGVAAGGFTIKDITSHDVKLGVRWDLDTPPPPPVMPLIRKG